jgi:hypothetical protein
LYDLTLSINKISPALKRAGNFIKIDYRLFFEETDGVHVNIATIKSATKNHNEVQNEFTADSPIWEGSI